ncbi:MAG: hypothetical protein JXO22_09850, partial [Phycisphaerae bacterium]|nr:hypothetical protein [Phycisphaerae bacterium]
PDLTIVLDVPPKVGFKRTGRTPQRVAAANRSKNHSNGQLSMFDGAHQDAMERRPIGYHRKVHEIFRELPSFYPKPVVVIDGTRDADAVFAAIKQELERAFE